MLTEELCDSKSSLSALAEQIKLYPQITVSIKVQSKDAVLNDPKVLEEKARIEKQINGKGRILLRKSGTEPVIRVMCECGNEEKCLEYVNGIASLIKQGGHTVD